MSTLATDAGTSDVGSRLTFFKNLQTVTNRIHATSNIDEIMLELSADVCALFGADRLTIYSVGEDKASIVSKIKTGLNSFKDLRLPIADQSIAGHVALAKKIVNIRDVYDDAELKAINPSLRFLQEVDKRTGYRTQQMLVSAIVDPQSQELLGVVQIINNKAGVPFSAVAEDGVKGLCETLAIAFNQRSKPAAASPAALDACRSQTSTLESAPASQLRCKRSQRVSSLPQPMNTWLAVPSGAATPKRRPPLRSPCAWGSVPRSTLVMGAPVAAFSAVARPRDTPKDSWLLSSQMRPAASAAAPSVSIGPPRSTVCITRSGSSASRDARPSVCATHAPSVVMATLRGLGRVSRRRKVRAAGSWRVTWSHEKPLINRRPSPSAASP